MARDELAVEEPESAQGMVDGCHSLEPHGLMEAIAFEAVAAVCPSPPPARGANPGAICIPLVDDQNQSN